MAQTIKPTAPAEADYIVTRAICLHGEPVKVGTIVTLSRVIGSELMAANKLAPAPAKPAKAEKKESAA